MDVFDLVIRNGAVVTGSGVACVDVAVQDGKIAQLGGPIDAERELDATGKLVLPGGIDAHVHLTMGPGRAKDSPGWVDDFTSGSAAALAGGFTTIGNMTQLGDAELPLDALAREASMVRAQAMADVILHPILREPSPEVLEQVPRLLPEGHNTIKIFMSSPAFDMHIRGFIEAVSLAGREGLLSMIHCEDWGFMSYAADELLKLGHTDVAYYPEARPIVSEVVATQRAVGLAELTGAPVHIVHLSSERALDVCRGAQARGVPVFVETRPLYLHLTQERFREPDGAKYVGQPPLRDQADVDALWAGLQNGTVTTLGSDHAPWSLEAKLDPELTVARVRPGVENLEVQLAMLYSEGVRKGRLTLERLVEVTSTNAAKLFGLYPRKGTVAVGSDADLVVFDPELAKTIDRPQFSNCDYSAYQGWEVTGWPVVTVRRGEVVFEEGNVKATPGSGQVLKRGKTRGL